MTIQELQKEAHSTAKDKGWWDTTRNIPELLCLIHSEISEALEEYRKGNNPNTIYFGIRGKPEGIPIELADTIIRIADFAEIQGIDLAQAIRCKLDYNKIRKYRHGGKLS